MGPGKAAASGKRSAADHPCAYANDDCACCDQWEVEREVLLDTLAGAAPASNAARYWHGLYEASIADREDLRQRIDSLKDGLAFAATVIGRLGSNEEYNYVVARLAEEGFDA